MNNKFSKRKAFTLIELLIVIAIIGILFIVLVSKVDFATDKAKATGVQTDFRSFQVAIESVAKENAGLATFGWDTGDTNGNRIRDSYDKGDTNKNGVQDAGEIFVGSKVYNETWTNVYTLTNPADANDKSAIVALEEAINKNLDPKLHITIADDGKITMANGAQDPWKTEYHGYYITNAETDGKDRGAIVLYSNGANGEHGSEHDISNGVVSVTVPNSNKDGKDDYSIVSCYTYVNGYGEVKNATSGFSNNQGFLNGNNDTLDNDVVAPDGDYDMLNGSNLQYDLSQPTVKASFRVDADIDKFTGVKVDGNTINRSNYMLTEGSTIVTLKQSYIESLSIGDHIIEIMFDDGFASTKFSVSGTVCEHELIYGYCNKCGYCEHLDGMSDCPYCGYKCPHTQVYRDGCFYNGNGATEGEHGVDYSCVECNGLAYQEYDSEPCERCGYQGYKDDSTNDSTNDSPFGIHKDHNNGLFCVVNGDEGMQEHCTYFECYDCQTCVKTEYRSIDEYCPWCN